MIILACFLFVFVTLVWFETARLLFSLWSSLSPVSCSRFTICVQFRVRWSSFLFLCAIYFLQESFVMKFSNVDSLSSPEIRNFWCAQLRNLLHFAISLVSFLCMILLFLNSAAHAGFLLVERRELNKIKGDSGMRSAWSFFVALLFVPASTLPCVWSLYCGVVQDHVVCFYNNHYSRDRNLGLCLHLCVGASFLAGSTRAVVPSTLKSCESRVASSHIWWDLLSEFVLCLSVAILSCSSHFSCSITALLCFEIWTKRRSEYEPGGAKTLYKLLLMQELGPNCCRERSLSPTMTMLVFRC
jgi:hypothetical protein